MAIIDWKAATAEAALRAEGALTREIAPVFAAIMVTARAGSAMAAELGNRWFVLDNLAYQACAIGGCGKPRRAARLLGASEALHSSFEIEQWQVILSTIASYPVVILKNRLVSPVPEGVSTF